MPAQPAYFHRLTEALDVFRGLSLDWVDRRTLQETLGVSKTVAWRILRHCGAAQGPGNTLVCPRRDLIASLERLQQTGAYEQEIRRRDRLESQLGDLLAVARSRRIRLASPSLSGGLRDSRLANLPLGVDLSPSRLLIEFCSLEDFLQKIGAMVFALQNDFESVQEFLS